MMIQMSGEYCMSLLGLSDHCGDGARKGHWKGHWKGYKKGQSPPDLPNGIKKTASQCCTWNRCRIHIPHYSAH